MTQEEDSLTNPAGRWQGTQQIKALYALLRDSYSERKLTFDTVSIHSYGDFAWTEFTGDFAAKTRKDGAPFSFHAAETQIYRKSRGKWCLESMFNTRLSPRMIQRVLTQFATRRREHCVPQGLWRTVRAGLEERMNSRFAR